MSEPINAKPAEGSHELSRSLQPRHMTMITIGGIIGAGLFVSSSAAIIAAGPAMLHQLRRSAGILILLIMRMLGEMAMALPNVRSFTDSRAPAWATAPASWSAGCTGTSGCSSFRSRRSRGR